MLRHWGRVLREGVLRLKVEGMGEWLGARRILPGRQKAGQRPEVFRGWGVHMTAAEGGGRDRYARSPKAVVRGLALSPRRRVSSRSLATQTRGEARGRRGTGPR